MDDPSAKGPRTPTALRRMSHPTKGSRRFSTGRRCGGAWPPLTRPTRGGYALIPGHVRRRRRPAGAGWKGPSAFRDSTSRDRRKKKVSRRRGRRREERRKTSSARRLTDSVRSTLCTLLSSSKLRTYGGEPIYTLCTLLSSSKHARNERLDPPSRHTRLDSVLCLVAKRKVTQPRAALSEFSPRRARRLSQALCARQVPPGAVETSPRVLAALAAATGQPPALTSASSWPSTQPRVSHEHGERCSSSLQGRPTAAKSETCHSRGTHSWHPQGTQPRAPPGTAEPFRCPWARPC